MDMYRFVTLIEDNDEDVIRNYYVSYIAAKKAHPTEDIHVLINDEIVDLLKRWEEDFINIPLDSNVKRVKELVEKRFTNLIERLT